MTANTTPAPWKWDRATGQVDCDGGTIAHGIGWAPNGPLLAAAPELLAVARALLMFYKAGWSAEQAAEWKRLTGRDEATTHVLGDLARAAIAKVEGREP